MQRKICVITGSRAEYGLLFWLLQEIRQDADLQLQLVVTGMHLSPEFGLTYRQIEADGFVIDRKVDMLLSADSPAAIAKSTGLALIGFADALADLAPDVVVVLGDRFEIFAAAQAALFLRIPIAHIHGGELTEGAVDDAIRHAISKMAYWHFTASDVYRQRVLQLGEAPERVFNTGAPGLDNIRRLTLLDRPQLEQALGFKLAQRNLLITFHPVTLEHASAAKQFGELLKALDCYPDAHLIFTLPNADAEGRVIIELIDAYRQRNPERVAVFTSLGSLRYLSALQFVDAVVGNSSSGLLEAPSFRIGTINIGDRQQGRLFADSVIHCQPEFESILAAFEKVFSSAFSSGLAQVENPYGQGGASVQIKTLLKTLPLPNGLKKQFHDTGK